MEAIDVVVKDADEAVRSNAGTVAEVSWDEFAAADKQWASIDNGANYLFSFLRTCYTYFH